MFAKKSISHIFSILFIISVLSVTPFQTAYAAGIRYATPGGTGDCSSWANACILQTAMTSATSGEEIWIAAGMYTPTTGSDLSATFQLIPGVAIYGGFIGKETARNQRNFTVNLTVLSGINDAPLNNYVAYHVVTGATGATLDGVTITAGYAVGSGGGGMYNSSSSPTLTNVIFNDNSAEYCGGMYNISNSNPVLTNVTFSGNDALYGGGGMCNFSGSNPTLTNVTFNGNKANSGVGGGIYNDSSSPTLTNVTFNGNSAGAGGGIYNYSSSPMLTNVTFNRNTANSSGGGIYNALGSSPAIRNTLLWGDTASPGAEIFNDGSTPAVSDSVVQGGCPAGSTCTNIITADPKLGPLGNYGYYSLTQTIPLLPGSSAIDTGNNTFCPATDQRGLVRPQGAHCDIGSYEYDYIIFSIYYVKPVSSGLGTCSSWTNACTLESALGITLGGDEIWVAAGVYKPTTDPTNRTATFQLKENVPLYGGFAGIETARDQRNPGANLTILSGDIDNNDSQTPIITDLVTVAGNTSNSFHVVTGGTGGTLDGFTITAGYAVPYYDGDPDRGGGIYSGIGASTIANVTFSGNQAFAGGGIYNSGNLMVTNVNFNANSAFWGGGLDNDNGSTILMNVTFVTIMR